MLTTIATAYNLPTRILYRTCAKSIHLRRTKFDQLGIEQFTKKCKCCRLMLSFNGPALPRSRSQHAFAQAQTHEANWLYVAATVKQRVPCLRSTNRHMSSISPRKSVDSTETWERICNSS